MSKHHTTNAVRVERRHAQMLQARVEREQRKASGELMEKLNTIIHANNVRRGVA